MKTEIGGTEALNRVNMTPDGYAAVIVGFTADNEDQVSVSQDKLCDALSRAQMPCEPNRTNLNGTFAVFELYLEENVDREFALQITKDVVDHFEFMTFAPDYENVER